jgi:hypothetical protein
MHIYMCVLFYVIFVCPKNCSIANSLHYSKQNNKNLYGFLWHNERVGILAAVEMNYKVQNYNSILTYKHKPTIAMKGI